MDDKDRLSFLNSPWLQLGVPLAAMAATAIAPRHTGAVARMGLAGWSGLNDTHMQQQRLSAVRAEKEREEAEKKKEIEDWEKITLHGGGGEAKPADTGANAPEGGSTPEAVEQARAGILEGGGGVPSPTWTPDARVLQKLGTLPPKIGWPIYAALVKQEMEATTGRYRPDDLSRLQSSLPAGGGASSIPMMGGYNASVNRPAPQLVQTHEDGEASMTRIDPESMAVTGKTRIGQYGSDSEHTAIVTKGDTKYMQFVTRDGVQKSVPLGPADKDDDELKATFEQKMWMLKEGKFGFDPVFESWVKREDAEKYFKEKDAKRPIGLVYGGPPIDSSEP